MRKILFSFVCIASVFLLSCNESGLNADEPVTIESRSFANKSMNEAITIAIDAAERLYPTQSRGYGHTASVKNVKSVTNPLSRAGENDTLLYVVNFDNEEGYAIIPAPNIDKKVLAVVENGSYDPEKGSDNPGFNYFMEAAKSYTANAAKNIKDSIIIVFPGELHPAFDSRTDTIAHYQIKPRLEGMEWGQTGIYNVFCPKIGAVNAAAGCVPTAIASIITGVKKVSDGTSSFSFTFPDNTFGTQNINWNELSLHKRQFITYTRNNGTKVYQQQLCNENYPYNAHNLIAALMRQIGYDGNANYGVSSTPVAKNKCKSLLEKYLAGHKISKFRDFKFDTAKTSLNLCILFMAGDGHAWVADGYDQLDYHYYFAKWDFQNKVWIVEKNANFSDRLIHFCWGWDGVDDGYFEGEVFNAFDYTFKKTQFISITVDYAQ